MTKKQLRDIHEECQRQKACFRCAYFEDSNCDWLWYYIRSIPEYLSYEELVQTALKEGLLDDD